ncbi:unnamed protein product [Brassica oleracea]
MMNTNLVVANRVDADIVTKTKTVAWFECIATIGDVAHGSSWYYIGCGGCHTKATKGPTSLMCKKCGKPILLVLHSKYLAKISVYDNDDQASFVLLGGVGHELSGKKASELVEKYFEANENVGDDHLVPVPQALIDSQIRCEGVRSQCDWQDPSFDCDKVADDDPSTCFGSVKRVADNVEAEYPKRARSG